MASPVEIIADALIAFILSLLRDPDAAEEFTAQPQGILDGHGLGNVCLADVAAVRPVIVDHPAVVRHRDPGPSDPGSSHDPATAAAHQQTAVQEIVRLVQQFTTVDARSTIIDQSVNQNIWTQGGDLTQIFDQEAVIASGDHAIAAGHDVTMQHSDIDVTTGDITVGNETYDGSFNGVGSADPDQDGSSGGDSSDDGTVDTPVPPDVPDAPSPSDAPAVPADVPAAPADAAIPAAASSVPEPADLLESDMTSGSGDTYDADASGAALNEQPVDAPLEDD